jgi:hypothetical protein
MWTDLVEAEVDPADIDGQTTAMLFALSKDLSTEQKHNKCKEGQTNRKGKTRVLILQDLLDKDRWDGRDIQVAEDPHDLWPHTELRVY